LAILGYVETLLDEIPWAEDHGRYEHESFIHFI